MNLARIRANLSNAQKSTGPRTAAGIKRSSQNATHHGLASTAIVVLDAVERRSDYEDLLGAILEGLSPVGAVETLLAERIAQALLATSTRLALRDGVPFARAA